MQHMAKERGGVCLSKTYGGGKAGNESRVTDEQLMLKRRRRLGYGFDLSAPIIDSKRQEKVVDWRGMP